MDLNRKQLADCKLCREHPLEFFCDQRLFYQSINMIMHFDTHNTGASAKKYKKIAFIIGKRDGNNRNLMFNR
jgi:hypothetical protein